MSKLCTGVAASWCPNCGNCICKRTISEGEDVSFDNPDCPLHGLQSRHAEEPEVDPIAAAEARGAAEYRDRLYDLATKMAESPQEFFAIRLDRLEADMISLGIRELLRRMETPASQEPGR